jgi:uncharacterized membrane protein
MYLMICRCPVERCLLLLLSFLLLLLLLLLHLPLLSWRLMHAPNDAFLC